jgi:hypothetical protein
MGYSKKQFIDSALEEIGLGRYAFDISPEQEESALRLLDSMMALWNAGGIRISYPLPSSPQYSDITAETTVPDAAYEAIRTNLALALAPQYGRQVMPHTTRSAAISLQVLRARFTVIPQMQFKAGTPLGAGNKPWRRGATPFIQSPTQTLDAGVDQTLEYN